MKRAWLLGLSTALLGAGLTVAQEIQPPAAPPSTPPDAAPSSAQAVTPGVPAEEAPPEESAPAPQVERAPVVEAEVEDAPPEPPPPLKRPRLGSAILQGMDKITAETFRFEAKVGEPVRYKGVVVTVHACETNAADEPLPESIAHLEVVSQPRAPPGRLAPAPHTLFRGWMFASSPSLHPFESPSYDLWLIACKASAPETPDPRA